MAAHWYFFTDEEHGPVTFPDLAAMVADGRLDEGDLVRRNESADWQRVDAVPGLVRAARRPQTPPSTSSPPRPAAAKRPIPSAAPPAPLPRSSGRGFREWWTRPRIAAAVASLCILFAIGRAIQYVLSRPEKYPESRQVTLARQAPALLDQMRAPRPKQPTLSDLPEGIATAVPGFEAVPWLKSPTLTDDLNTIVYVTYRGDSTTDDLMLASRSAPALPFVGHHPIDATVTEHRESHPTLSPDGLELVYVVNATPSHLFRVRRADLQSEFSMPERVLIEGDPFDGLHHDAPQFIDPLTLVFTAYDNDFKRRSHVLAKRSTPTTGFVYVDTLPVADPWPRYAYSRRLARAYYANADGIFLTARHPATKEFVTPEPLLSSATTGPEPQAHDGTLWIAPTEDLMFYCSPGNDPAQARDSRLWMLRF